MDEQIFVSQSVGGAARYFVELIQALRAHDYGVDIVLPWRLSFSRLAADAGLGSRVALRPTFRRRTALRLVNSIFERDAAGADVIHHTYYSPEWDGRLDGKRVATVYDMIPEIYPDDFPAGNPHEAKLKYVTEADAVLCISETTRQDLTRCYPDLRGEVVVTPLGVTERFSPGGQRPEGFPQSYLLHVGGRSRYKDFFTLARALAGLPNEIQIMAVGGGPFSAQELSELTDLGVVHRCIQRSLSDDQLPGAYSNALATVIPSRYEGSVFPLSKQWHAPVRWFLPTARHFRRLRRRPAGTSRPETPSR
jgi:glycosyltransferase involved in cell wall biosynthesis